MPVVQVPMNSDCHKALKLYAAYLGITMGELMYRCARHSFHKQAQSCKWMNSTLKSLEIELDKGSDKPCFGFCCNMCSKRTECRTGVYKGLAVLPEKHKQTNL